MWPLPPQISNCFALCLCLGGCMFMKSPVCMHKLQSCKERIWMMVVNDLYTRWGKIWLSGVRREWLGIRSFVYVHASDPIRIHRREGGENNRGWKRRRILISCLSNSRCVLLVFLQLSLPSWLFFGSGVGSVEKGGFFSTLGFGSMTLGVRGYTK